MATLEDSIAMFRSPDGKRSRAEGSKVDQPNSTRGIDKSNGATEALSEYSRNASEKIKVLEKELKQKNATIARLQQQKELCPSTDDRAAEPMTKKRRIE